jgi:hypothetical protein
MAGLKDVFQDLLAKVSADTSIEYCRIWNNQLELQQNAETYSFPNLACFIEIDTQRANLGLGVSGGDITIKFHIVHVEYDATDGTMEQNLNVFTYRDEIINVFTFYEPVACSGLQIVSEQPDYNHNNVYHYIIEFNTHFIDDKANQLDSLIEKEPPTDLEIVSGFDNLGLNEEIPVQL